MIFLNLLLAHLMADFVFQPQKLVMWKFRSWKGTAVHALVHFVANVLLLLPFLFDVRVWLVITGIGLSHFFIDSLKIEREKHGKHYPVYFCADQFAHLSVVFLAAGALSLLPISWEIALWGNSMGNFFMILGINILIVITYVLEIFYFQLRRVRHPTRIFDPDYKLMLKRAIVFSLLYVFFMIFGVYHVAALGF